jgi:hypothetical protein
MYFQESYYYDKLFSLIIGRFIIATAILLMASSSVLSQEEYLPVIKSNMQCSWEGMVTGTVSGPSKDGFVRADQVVLANKEIIIKKIECSTKSSPKKKIELKPLSNVSKSDDVFVEDYGKIKLIVKNNQKYEFLMTKKQILQITERLSKAE